MKEMIEMKKIFSAFANKADKFVQMQKQNKREK